MKTSECSQYARQSHTCLSGFPAVSGACFGIVEHGCTSCGKGATTPPCMKEELGPAFVRDDGLPINWPGRDAAPGVGE
jgi:hypothetical protein